MCRTSSSNDDDDNVACSNSLCCTLHTLDVPYEDGCLSTWVGLINGLVLLFMFAYVLRKIFSSNRRSRAGYTKNTVSLDTHVTLLEGVLVWTVAWGLFQVFSFKDGTADLPPPFMRKGSRFSTICTTCLMYGSTEAFMVLILALLVSDSIGKNNLRRASIAAGCYGIAVASSIGFVMYYTPGNYNKHKPSLPAHLNLVMIVIAIFDASLMLVAVIVTKRIAPERKAVRRFAYFQGAISVCLIVARLLSFRAPMASLNSAGLCLLDLTLFVYFLLFAPVIYMTLKKDSAYWMHDNDDDDERRALIDWGDQTLIQELPIFEDVVIPKTELYLRKKLEDRIDTCIEVHLWRRSLVVVKRFKLDFLTRDNIKLFKKEAAINRKLTHENVIRFLGVVIDPPCMSIVMEYGSRGDLFSFLKFLNDKVMEEQRSSSSFASCYSQSEAQDIFNPILQQTTSSSNPSLPTNAFNPLSFNPIKCALDIASGMRYLHSHDMVHCDLKSANVVLDADLNAKITDFGDVEEAVKQRNDSRNSTYSGNARSLFGRSTSRIRSSSALVSRLSEEDLSEGTRGLNQRRNRTSSATRNSAINAWNNSVSGVAGGGRSGGGAIGGLGSSELRPDMKYGTVPWAAPELVVGALEPSFASDAFSFGMVMWELVTWKVPFLLVARLDEDMRTNSSSHNRSSTGSITSFDGEPQGGGILPSLNSVSSDVFRAGKRVGRREKDRLANMRSDTAVLSMAGEVATSSHHHRRRTQESPLPTSRPRNSTSSFHSSNFTPPSGAPLQHMNNSHPNDPASAAEWAQRLLAVERARTLVPVDDSEIGTHSLTMNDADLENALGVIEGNNIANTDEINVNHMKLRDDQEAQRGSGEVEGLSSPLLHHNRTSSTPVQPAKYAFPVSNDDMNLREHSIISNAASSGYGYGGGGGGGGYSATGGSSATGGLNSSWNGRRGGGVQAVEVTTPEEACELMCVSRYRPPLPVRVPTNYVSLMRQCWKQDRDERPDFMTLLNRLEALHYAQNSKDVASRTAFPCGIASFANYDE